MLTTQVTPVSIWALNFALMFALALGIDYALFLVVRFRAALKRRGVQPGDQAGVVAAVAETLDTAGKAVTFSALTVIASLAAILLVPSPAFRGTALGIILAVAAVLAATLTLLPAVIARLGTRINAGRLIGRRSTAKASPLDDRLDTWGRLLWRHPLAAGLAALAVLFLAALPVLGLRTDMPSITIVPADTNAALGYDQITKAFGRRTGGLAGPGPRPPSKRGLGGAGPPTRSGCHNGRRPTAAGPSTRSFRPLGRPPPLPGPPSIGSATCYPPAAS